MLSRQLDKEDFTYTDCMRDDTPGHDKDQQLKDHINNADFIICFFTFDDGSISPTMRKVWDLATVMKRRDCQNDHVLPICCGMEQDQVTMLQETLPTLAMVSHVIAQKGDKGWIDKIMSVLCLSAMTSEYISCQLVRYSLFVMQI